MRAFEFLRESAGQPFTGEVYHCSNARFDRFIMNPDRGVYFANEPDHDYGRYVYRCRITLNNAITNSSLDNFEIDRHILISQGYDGRIVDYAEETFEDQTEMFDYIAFYDHQIDIIEVTERTT